MLSLLLSIFPTAAVAGRPPEEVWAGLVHAKSGDMSHKWDISHIICVRKALTLLRTKTRCMVPVPLQKVRVPPGRMLHRALPPSGKYLAHKWGIKHSTAYRHGLQRAHRRLKTLSRLCL